MLEKLKSLILNDQAFYSLLIIVVAVISFWLGRLSLVPNEPMASRVQVLQPQNFNNATATGSNSVTETSSGETSQASGVVVGSRSGTRYHLPTCPGAKQIKPENLINFSNIAAAEAAGYKPAANCPQLQ